VVAEGLAVAEITELGQGAVRRIEDGKRGLVQLAFEEFEEEGEKTSQLDLFGESVG
jgi:hypothetical protein